MRTQRFRLKTMYIRPTTHLLTDPISGVTPAPTQYLSPTVSIRRTSQSITNPGQRQVASTQDTGLRWTPEMASSTAYSSGISPQGVEVQKTSTTCSTALRTAGPRGL